MEDRWRVQDTAYYICTRNFSIVTLQFPDESLQHAARVCMAVTAACEARGHAVQAYILADTTYNSLSVDEVAAAHVNAQCVVHYGRASLTKLSRLPAFFVFPQQQLNVQAAAACLASSSLLSTGTSSGRACSSPVLVFLDQPLLHQLEALKAALLQLMEQQQGATAAARLVFPTVPHQHMEPEQHQQLVQPPSAGGCSRAGACGSQQQQQQQQQQEQHPVDACCCTVPGSDSAGSEQQEQVILPLASAGDGQQASISGNDSGNTDAGQHSLAGYQWVLPAGVEPRDCGLVWVGAQDAAALLQLQVTYNACPWAMLDPTLLPPASSNLQPAAASTDVGTDSRATSPASSPTIALREGLPLEISRTLRRRYFLVQKAREARIVGILVGTLGAAGYADAVSSLRAAAAAAGKKTYTVLMGKPSPAKLANFPEIEVFVLVADPQGQVLDSKEYLAPIITPHEAQLAFAQGGCGEWDERHYRLDFEGVLQQAASGPAAAGAAAAGVSRRQQEPHFSLVSGGHYTGGGGGGSGSGSEEEDAAVGEAGMALALHAQQALQVSTTPAGQSDLVDPKSAADYLLHKRSWQGVEAPLVGAAQKPVEAAVEGRSGRAAGYVNELGHQQQQ